MRVESGVTTRYIYFVAEDAGGDRVTGLSSFTVYRSRNGGTAAAMTTPTINETDSSNMPGVYELLLDEDMTIGSGNDSEEMVFHITATGMEPVTRSIELYRPKITAGNTLGVESDGDLTKVNTLHGHTAQTGDSFARLGAPAGASVSADIATVDSNVDAVLVDTSTTLDNFVDDLESRLGTPSNLGGGATIAQNLVDMAGAAFATATDSLEAVRDHIGNGSNLTEAGGTGDHLTAVPWNSAWDAEVQSEVADGLAAYDPPTHAELISEINDVQTDIAALNNLSAGDVNAQMVDVLATDTYVEPTGVPGASETLATKISYIYMALRNELRITSTKKTFYDDTGNPEWEKDLSDDGTTYTESEGNTI